jgi:hypothetical protein
MQRTGITAIECPYFKLSFRKSVSVVIDDEEALPEDVLKVKTTTAPDKTQIKRLIQAGSPVSGMHLQENQNLQIK